MNANIKAEEFNEEYKAWRKHANPWQRERLPELLKEYTALIKHNPEQAAKMLCMYQLTCGPIAK